MRKFKEITLFFVQQILVAQPEHLNNWNADLENDLCVSELWICCSTQILQTFTKYQYAPR